MITHSNPPGRAYGAAGRVPSRRSGQVGAGLTMGHGLTPNSRRDFAGTRTPDHRAGSTTLPPLVPIQSNFAWAGVAASAGPAIGARPGAGRVRWCPAGAGRLPPGPQKCDRMVRYPWPDGVPPGRRGGLGRDHAGSCRCAESAVSSPGDSSSGSIPPVHRMFAG